MLSPGVKWTGRKADYLIPLFLRILYRAIKVRGAADGRDIASQDGKSQVRLPVGSFKSFKCYVPSVRIH